MINEFTLIVNKWKVLRNWESIRITQSMDSACGSISLKTSMFNPQDPLINSIILGDEYLALINGMQIGNGFIEKIPISYNANSMSIDIAGRDKTCDIIDSHVKYTTEKKGVTPYNWILGLLTPFKIGLTVDKTAAKEMATVLSKASAEIGETVLDAILRVCNQVGVMPISKGDGKLTITKGPSKISINNLSPNTVLEARLNQTNIDRFDKYICVGQKNGSDADTKPEDYIQVRGEWDDKTISRYRPYIIIEDRPTNINNCKARALFERNYRAGHSRSLEYVVEGWTKPLIPDLWRINEEVMVLDQVLYIFRPLLISEVVFMYTQGSGFKTRLKLVHPSTYAANLDIEQYNTLSDEGGEKPTSRSRSAFRQGRANYRQ